MCGTPFTSINQSTSITMRPVVPSNVNCLLEDNIAVVVAEFIKSPWFVNVAIVVRMDAPGLFSRKSRARSRDPL